MTQAYLELDDTGVYVTGGGYASRLQDGTIPLANGVRPESLLNHYLVDGVLVPRPVCPVPVAIEGGWRIADCPAATVIMVHSVEGEEILHTQKTGAAGEDFDFALGDPGKYIIEVSAPRPYTTSMTNIEVI